MRKEQNNKMFQHGKIGKEKFQSIGLWNHKRVYSHNNYPRVSIGKFIYSKGYFRYMVRWNIKKWGERKKPKCSLRSGKDF